MANQVNVSFKTGETATLTSANKNVSTTISFDGEEFAPYELFLGGYASCLHATFDAIIKKKRLTYDGCNYEVYATKREELPTLLNYVKTTITFTGVEESKQKTFIRSLEMAERYCSISAMINDIAKMEFEYIFN